MALAAVNWVLPVFAGLFGAAGVGLAAAAAHVTGAANLLTPASAIALAHAPAVLALYLAADRLPTATAAGLILCLGVLLFCGDLVLKQFTGHGLFPMAAPSGGFSMMAGWLLVAVGAFF
ncbi:DUF423 domain-containing protein [Rhizobium paknamense]|uniref:Uncharacterized membrane protein YgdD (TMEM256/DUF423 family) n=1 Tax=Rhizobium paknamense TaxID=1206817 RepID=A0ABU0IA81_9HYPH|nr:DUF423 domain-containing protein [Rhizobium paknamense]MDQ0454385.1 uncharacterized membrane protein YgdD (TMEM256/DUF423 family) [Rhizobium paknamense]